MSGDEHALKEELAELLQRRAVPELNRSLPGEDIRNQHVEQFADDVATALQQESEQITGSVWKDLPTDAGDRDRLRELIGRAERERADSMKPLRIAVRPGCRVVGTPYDVDWSLNGGFGFFSRHDGNVTIVGLEGESAAGVGLYLTSDTDVDLLITPHGDYSWSWFSVEDAPTWRSGGGLGLAIYDTSQATPLHASRARLWSFSGTKAFTGGKGDGLIPNASSPAQAGTFGPVPLAPVIVRVRAGRQLLVWVWGWQVNRKDERGSLAFLTMRMPAVQICGGPPLVIR